MLLQVAAHDLALLTLSKQVLLFLLFSLHFVSGVQLILHKDDDADYIDYATNLGTTLAIDAANDGDEDDAADDGVDDDDGDAEW